ncbi:MAG: AAA family ATPase [Acidimicrobiales bacterium]
MIVDAVAASVPGAGLDRRTSAGCTPKGILLYHPRAMASRPVIAKAVGPRRWPRRSPRPPAPASRSYASTCKPATDLLNKYVGGRERRSASSSSGLAEKSEEGMPVIIFFDEMESLFRTRGSGISRPTSNPPSWSAAHGRDRRCRNLEEHHRHRRLQREDAHRPGHPATGPPRRGAKIERDRVRRPPPRSSLATSPTISRSTPPRSRPRATSTPPSTRWSRRR